VILIAREGDVASKRFFIIASEPKSEIIKAT
jgi:hypothetical protein